MKILVGLIVILSLLLSTYLFRKAAGSLKISKMNIISFAFYNLLIFTCIGSVIILFGFKDHYLVEKINSEEVIYRTVFFLSYTMIMFPLAIRMYSKLFIRGNVLYKYEVFLGESVDFESSENTAFTLTVIATVLGYIFTMLMFYRMGGIPLLNLIRTRSVSAILRISVTHDYAGNLYFRNIVILMLTPLLSYLSYIYMRISKHHKIKWMILFILDALLAIFIKTYNLEKSPIVYWFFYFFIVEIMIGNKNATRFLKKIGILLIALIAIMYYIFYGYAGDLVSLSSGPLSRIIMTQASTLFLHFQVFPQNHAFLHGASLPKAIAWMFGSSESWVRSGSIVMQIYNAKGVASGEAGVMNAMFIGEAYANWGTVGVLISPFIVAIPFVIAYGILLKQPKTPLKIVLYVALTISFVGSLQGGFVDYIYNINLIILLAVALFIQALVRGGRIRIKR